MLKAESQTAKLNQIPSDMTKGNSDDPMMSHKDVAKMPI